MLSDEEIINRGAHEVCATFPAIPEVQREQ